MEPHGIRWAICACLLAQSLQLLADWQTDIGYKRLIEELGPTLTTGKNVAVAQIEAAISSDHDLDPSTPKIYVWLQDESLEAFMGKQIKNNSGSSTEIYSPHATSVAHYFFGNDHAMAYDITTIDNFWQAHWVGNGYLHARQSLPSILPATSHNRIANHSWAGVGNSELLKRIDWIIDRDEYVHCAGVNNGESFRSILSGAYNTISVGRTDAQHTTGSVGLDSFYVANRTRPDLVVPVLSTSAATAIVSSASAILIELGQQPALSNDPVKISKTNRLGDTIYNASRSEVMKAVLMAGAERYVNNANQTKINSYVINRQNGLNDRYGAGQINIYNSYKMITAGEQNSLEDMPTSKGLVAKTGFDYDPEFGGLIDCNQSATYRLPIVSHPHLLKATLAWNVTIGAMPSIGFTDLTKLFNLDLILMDESTGHSVISYSRSKLENTENIWHTLEPGHQYYIKVFKPDGYNFRWDYALAWRLAPDTDNDGIEDSRDNCPYQANALQLDGNQDGMGDRCDVEICAADLNKDGLANWGDLELLRSNLGQKGCEPESCSADVDNNGLVNVYDLIYFFLSYKLCLKP